MATQEFLHVSTAHLQGAPSDRQLGEHREVARYRRPRLAFVGNVTRMVQSGPVGNRYETYACRYWSDR